MRARSARSNCSNRKPASCMSCSRRARFKSGRIVRIEVIDPYDAISAFQQASRNVKSDEAGSPRDQDRFASTHSRLMHGNRSFRMPKGSARSEATHPARLRQLTGSPLPTRSSGHRRQAWRNSHPLFTPNLCVRLVGGVRLLTSVRDCGPAGAAPAMMASPRAISTSPGRFDTCFQEARLPDTYRTRTHCRLRSCGR